MGFLNIKKELLIGSQFPFGYGLAYYNVRETTDDEQIGVCYPIPLNWIVAYLRSVYHKLQWRPWMFKIDSTKMTYDKGYYKGFNEGYKMGVQNTKKEVKENDTHG